MDKGISVTLIIVFGAKVIREGQTKMGRRRGVSMYPNREATFLGVDWL